MNRLVQFTRNLLRQRALLVFLAILAIYGGYLYWRQFQYYESTDDAYVGAHVVSIAAQVAGPVKKVYIHDDSVVQAGQPLFEINEHPYKIALAAAEANVRVQQAVLANAQSINGRTHQMAARHFLSSQSSDNAQTAVQADKARLEVAQATLAQARLNLRHCLIHAPTTGLVTHVRIRPGAYIQAGTPLFALIASTQYWVTANFKETELRHIVAGDHAHIHIDMYPNYTFQGVVEDVSGGSGTAFSLLPPENATGNWVKVTQRVPVRIVIQDPNPKLPLRIGTSANVTVFYHRHHP